MTYTSRACRFSLGLDWHLLACAVRDSDAYFLVSAWNHPTAQALLTLLCLLRRSYGIWTDTPNLKRKRPLLKAVPRGAWLRWIFSRAAHVLGTGSPGIEALHEMGAPSSRLINFPFYIDLSAYTAKARPRDRHSRPLRFLSIGRLDNAIKGHDIAIQALAVASQGRAFEYLIAGTGKDERQLKELAKDVGLERQITFLGWIEPNELRLLCQQSDVLIHPSPAHDPFPNAILEAMATGLVVLGSNVSGSAVDRIDHGINGFLHSAGDVNELSRQLIYLFDYPERISDIAKNARATAEHWPLERAITTIHEIVCGDTAARSCHLAYKCGQ